MHIRSRHCSGHTLVEVVVALLVFSTGLVATAALLSAGAMAINEGGRLGAAATAANTRSELLHIVGCLGSTGTEEPVPGVIVRWTAGGGSPGRGAIVVEVATRGRTRADTLRTVYGCP